MAARLLDANLLADALALQETDQRPAPDAAKKKLTAPNASA
jgi:hypothetical protein